MKTPEDIYDAEEIKIFRTIMKGAADAEELYTLDELEAYAAERAMEANHNPPADRCSDTSADR